MYMYEIGFISILLDIHRANDLQFISDATQIRLQYTTFR